MHKSLLPYEKALREEPFALAEYQTLMGSAKHKLLDAKNRRLSLESRFDLAYASAFGFALAALRRTGYRPNHQRWVVFQVIPFTLQLSEAQANVLITAHEIRNRAIYDGESQVSQVIVQDVIDLAEIMSAYLSEGP